ncbi:acyl-CoA thioesterase [Streptomyces sp. NPDC006923]|uniref:acyl-CoA thioesterase n=1 Tax=Streptomyces sp. NPDC006923 TaxID=3155355 RepID=UPI0033CA083C
MFFDESRLDLPVRPDDLDALGHVNNAVVLAYLEAGRRHWLESRGAVDAAGAVAVVSRAEVDYLAEIAYGAVEVRTVLHTPSAADFDEDDVTFRAVFRQSVHRPGAPGPAVEALVTVAFLDAGQRHLIPLQDYLSAVLTDRTAR